MNSLGETLEAFKDVREHQQWMINKAGLDRSYYMRIDVVDEWHGGIFVFFLRRVGMNVVDEWHGGISVFFLTMVSMSSMNRLEVVYGFL